jgi:hypothetical protein
MLLLMKWIVRQSKRAHRHNIIVHELKKFRGINFRCVSKVLDAGLGRWNAMPASWANPDPILIDLSPGS